MASVISVADAIVASTGVEKIEAVAITLDKTPVTLLRFKLPQLQAIIRTLKDSGYNQSVLKHYGNKPQLAQMLLDAIRLEGTNTVASPPPVNNAALARAAGASSAGKPPAPAASATKAPIVPQTGTGSASKPPQPKLHGHVAPPGAPARTAPAAAPVAAAPKNPYAKYPELNSRRKIEAYQMLRQVEGVSRQEILAELGRLGANEEVDEDMILFSIVAKREGPGGSPGGSNEDEEEELDAEELALKAQEDRDMDRAILESEKERDVIQDRKRQRVEELRKGKDGFLTSAEFQKSVLLHGCGDCQSKASSAQPTPVKPAAGTGHRAGQPDRALTQVASAALRAVHSAAAAHSSTGLSNRAGSSSSSSTVGGGGSSSSGGAGAIGGSKGGAMSRAHTGASDVVDLTLDSSPESRPVRAVTHPSSSSSSSSNNMGYNASAIQRNGSSTSGSYQAAPVTLPSTPMRRPTNPGDSLCAASHEVSAAAEVDLSRSKLLFLLVRLLDEISYAAGDESHGSKSVSGHCSNGNSSGSSSSTSSSSSSSGSSSSSSRPAGMPVYDVTHPRSCSAACLAAIEQLRPALSRLLLLEVNVIKFYPKVSSPCLMYLARKLDHKLLCDSIEAARSSLQRLNAPLTAGNNGSAANAAAPAGSAVAATDCILALPEKKAYWSNAAVVQLITSECNKLERGMYKLPTDGNMVPAVFRRAKLDCFERALASRIETDGIEVLDAAEAAGLAKAGDTGTVIGGGAGNGVGAGVSACRSAGPSAGGGTTKGRAVLMDTSAGYFSSEDDASQWSQPSSYHSSDSED